MEISFVFSTDNDFFVIIGSNGLIGNKILENFERRKEHFDIFKKEVKNYDLIFESIISFLDHKKTRKYDRFYLIFCAGKGGFSLDLENADIQSIRFENFVKRIYQENIVNMKFFLISSLGCYLSKIDSPYKKLMKSNEKFILLFKESYILRLPSIWGFNKKNKEPKGLIGNLIFSIKNLNESRIFGDLNTSRNYISADKIGINLFLFLQKKEFPSRIYNFSNQNNHSINDIILLIKKITKKNVFFKIYPGKSEDKESYIIPTNSDVNIKVKESINEEIYKLWMSL